MTAAAKDASPPAGLRPPLHEEAVDRIRGMILGGELLGGQRVPEKRLCEELVISRTPLREALKVLASENLLVLLPNRGARVAMWPTGAVDVVP